MALDLSASKEEQFAYIVQMAGGMDRLRDPQVRAKAAQQFRAAPPEFLQAMTKLAVELGQGDAVHREVSAYIRTALFEARNLEAPPPAIENTPSVPAPTEDIYRLVADMASTPDMLKKLEEAQRGFAQYGTESDRASARGMLAAIDRWRANSGVAPTQPPVPFVVATEADLKAATFTGSSRDALGTPAQLSALPSQDRTAITYAALNVTGAIVPGAPLAVFSSGANAVTGIYAASSPAQAQQLAQYFYSGAPLHISRMQETPAQFNNRYVKLMGKNGSNDVTVIILPVAYLEQYQQLQSTFVPSAVPLSPTAPQSPRRE